MDDIEQNNLQEILDVYEEGDELEIRLRDVFDERIESEVTPYIYYYLIRYLSQMPEMEKLVCMYTQTNYPNGIRVLDRDTASATITLKNRKKILDHEDFIRVALSSERHDIKDLPDDIGSYIDKRKRLRTSFINSAAGYRIDITRSIVLDHKNKKLVGRNIYDVEIEFTRIPSLDLLESVIDWIKNIYSCAYHFQEVIERFNLMFPEKQRFSGTSKREIKELYTGSSKPINLKVENIPYLTNYVFLPKPNGVNYFMFFDVLGVYLLNDTDAQKIMDPIDEYTGTIVLGERMHSGFGSADFKGKDVFLGFDTLMYNGKNVRHLDALKRHEFLQEFESAIPGYFYVLPMYFSGKNPERAIKDTFSYIQDTFFPNENDGIVMKHNFSNYSYKIDKKSPYKFPVWKWKPGEHITIDFAVYTEPSTAKYTLKSYGENDAIMAFRGTEKIPYSQTVDVPQNLGDIHQGTIVEFSWDGNNFRAERVRDDKIKPNFITVAQSTWEDIFSPITEKNLIDLSLYYIDTEESNKQIADKLCKFILKTRNVKVLDNLTKYMQGDSEISDGFRKALKYAEEHDIPIFSRPLHTIQVEIMDIPRPQKPKPPPKVKKVYISYKPNLEAIQPKDLPLTEKSLIMLNTILTKVAKYILDTVCDGSGENLTAMTVRNKIMPKLPEFMRKYLSKILRLALKGEITFDSKVVKNLIDQRNCPYKNIVVEYITGIVQTVAETLMKITEIHARENSKTRIDLEVIKNATAENPDFMEFLAIAGVSREFFPAVAP